MAAPERTPDEAARPERGSVDDTGAAPCVFARCSEVQRDAGRELAKTRDYNQRTGQGSGGEQRVFVAPLRAQRLRCTGDVIRRLPNSPYFIVVPATSLVVALASTGLGLEPGAILGGAAFGAVWGVGLGALVERVIDRDDWRQRLADGTVFLGIVGSGVMLGGGVMYALLMSAAATAPPAILSAMMQPTIPFFIVLNTPLELVGVPGAVFANWHQHTRRRLMVIVAAAFYTLRIWSYVVYVSGRMEIASRPLSPQDLEWFERSMGVDYRPLLVAIVFVGFTIAAFVRGPAAASHHRPR